MNKTYLSFLILLFLSNVSFSTNTVSVINHSSFPNVPQSLFDTETTNFCLMFRGVTPLTNSIILSANNGSSEALQDYINIDKKSLVLYNELFAIASFEVSTDETTNIVLHLFSQHREDEFMRLCFGTKKRITFSIGITLASSHKENKIVHADLEKFAQFTYYNLNSDQVVGLTVMADEANDSLKLNSTFKFTVDLSFNFASDKKVILGDKVCLRFSMDNVEISDSIESSSMPTLNPDTNQLENKLTFDKMNVGNYRVLCNFKEDLSRGRTFRLFFSNLKFKSCGTGDYKFKAELLWKNTNSIIGKNEVDMGLSCSSYNISSGKIEHTSKMKKLFTNTNWPIIITFKPDESFSDKTITISGPTGINFLQATCFVETNGTNSICSSSKGTNGVSILKIQKAIATKAVDYRIRVWIDATDVVASGFKYSVSIDGFSSFLFPSSFEILEAIENFSEVYNFSLINSKDDTSQIYLSTLTSTTTFQIRETIPSLDVVKLPLQFFSITETNTLIGNYNMFFPLGYTTINKDKTLKYIQLKAGFKFNENVVYPDGVDYSVFQDVSSSSFENLEAKNSIYLNSPTINSDLQGISFKNYVNSSGVNSAKIYLFKYFQTYPKCPTSNPPENMPCVTNSNVSNGSNPIVFTDLNFDIKFSDFVTLKKYDQSYYYGDFDFIITFTLENSTIKGYKRYVSLIGMISGFSNHISEEKIKVSFLKTTTSTLQSEYPGIKNSICILEIDFTNLDTGTSGLIGMFLYGINPLNFEKMSSYPVQGSNIIARVGYEVPDLFTEPNNLDLYVHSSMQFPLSSTLSTVFVPISCLSANEMTLNFFNYNFTSGKYVAKTNYIKIIKKYTTETDNIKFQKVSQSVKAVKCEKIYQDDKFSLKSYNDYDSSNKIDSDFQIVSFSFFSQKPANLIKLCNDSNEDLAIDSKKYITFTDNKLTLLNNKTYLSGIIFFNNKLDPAVKLGYVTGTGTDLNPKIANVKICPGQNFSAENLDQSFLAMSFITNSETEVLGNFKSEVNSTYCPLTTVTDSQFDSKVLKITINTTKIKLPVIDTMINGNNYICATYSVKPRINTKKIIITLDGITKDHTQCKNFGIGNEEILVDNGTIEIRLSATNLNNINFSCCNIELTRIPLDDGKINQTVQVRNLKFYDGDDIIYNYVKDTDSLIIADIIKVENKDQQPAKVTRATFSGAASYSS